MKKKRIKGVFIAFEGGEGSGKTTVIDFIAAALKKAGFEALVTHEPGGTRIGDKIREILASSKNTDIRPRTELMLFLASRAQHVSEVIKPALKASKVVLCDRFSGSTYAYQFYGRKMADFKDIAALDGFAREDLWPDLIILLDIDPKIGIGARGKNTTRFEKEKMEFHRRVRKGYLDLAKKGRGSWIVIDASKPLKEVEEAALRVIKEYLGRK